MAEPQKMAFDALAFLREAGLGRRIVQFKPKQAFFSQGGPADSIFYLQRGRAKQTVVSKNGKEVTIALFAIGDFIGEESLATVGGPRLASVTAITACTALKIDREEMVRVIHEEHSFSDLFVKFLLAHSMRSQADLIDQLFNSSEKRLARILLLLAEFGKPGELELKFKERWPDWFRHLYSDPRTSCLYLGFTHGDGWFDLVWQLCEQIEPIVLAEPGPEPFEVYQVKKKFGGLRFYNNHPSERIEQLSTEAAVRSFHVCRNLWWAGFLGWPMRATPCHPYCPWKI
jgi:CRP/FNR family transcriptional regulator, cyclic AMP receptor protein